MSTRIRFSSLLLAASFFFPGASSPLLAQPLLLLMGDSGPDQSFRVGDSLGVALRGAKPFGTYEFELLGAEGQQLARQSARADAGGEVAPRLLWAYSGVRTCASQDLPDPRVEAFTSWEEAEWAILDRELLVQVNDGDMVVALSTFTATEVDRERAYLSDFEGRPCHCFKAGEDVFLSLRLPERWAPHRRIFVVAESFPPLAEGHELFDVRGAGSLEFWTLPNMGNLLTEKIWEGAGTEPGKYDVILRQEEALTATESVLLPGDLLLSGPWSAERSGRGIALVVDCKGGHGLR